MSAIKTKINILRYELCFDMSKQKRMEREEELLKLRKELQKLERVIDAQRKAA